MGGNPAACTVPANVYRCLFVPLVNKESLSPPPPSLTLSLVLEVFHPHGPNRIHGIDAAAL